MYITTHILLTLSLLFIVMGRHLDFRERFLERKRLRSIKDQRITTLNNYVLVNTEILDDIPHYRKIKGRSSPAWKKIRAIEKDFRRLLAMDGVKYNYKRDLFWRTWRSMPPVNGATKQIVSYKCNNLIHGNGKAYQNCGMWTIDERPPPCPFEFFSVLSDEKLCGVNYTQYKDVSSICPSVIRFTDLTATCDNPIETQWRFTKLYGVAKKHDGVICKNKDVCDIFTSYEITSEQVVFRIINSTNDVIYSRIMKAKNKNYICVDECGRFNPYTRKVTKPDKPLKLDLLTVRKMKKKHVLDDMNNNFPKREIVWKEINDSFHLPTELTKGEDVSNEMYDSGPKRDFVNEINKGLRLPTELTKSKMLKDIKHPTEENMSLSNFGGDEVRVSVEKSRPLDRALGKRMMSIKENPPHKIKSRRMKGRLRNDMNFVEARFILKPTVTPHQKLEREVNHVMSYEDENSEN